MTGRMKNQIGKLVDQALNKMWNMKDESPLVIVKNMVKWGNFLSVWNFYSKSWKHRTSTVSAGSVELLQ